ncbi:MAG TPA: phage holin family protein [Streptosporangiaceae bacterium]|nr:phage holin family protein [Streptosporangiaceae bacterium]
MPASAAQAQAAAQDPSSASVGELVGSITKDLSTLMRQELDLAKAEVKEEAIKSGKAAGMYGAAGFAGYMVLLFASIAGWWGLANVMDEGWAALIVTGVWAVIGAVAYSAGRRQARQIHPTPERTVETVKEIPEALKGQAGNSA